jgi:CHASE3 domain sensor protein
MPKVALADSLIDWENLIANASVHEADDPVLARNLAALRAVLAHAKETAAYRLHLEAERQVATQALAQDKMQGKHLAMQVRHSLRAIYTARGPRLAAFGMKPRPLAKGAAPPKPQFEAPDDLDAIRDPE